MLTQAEAGALKDFGYYLLRGTSVHDLVRAAETLGIPRPSKPHGPIVNLLTPKAEADARPGTISAHFGHSAFPWHSDGVVDRDPPHYLLMRAENVNTNSATTDLLDLRRFLERSSSREYGRLVCEIRTRTSSYLSPFLTRRNGVSRTKWDPLRMRALGKHAAEFHEDISKAEPTYCQRWENGDLLIVDNWRFLHRRSDASSDSHRTIQRVVVKGLPE